jgi:hypothetical protein
MMRAYVAAGLNPDGFWKLTPRLYLAQMRGASDRMDGEQRDRAWLAWHVEALSRQKTLPDAAKFIAGDAGKVERGGDVVLRLATLRASLPTITQEQWRAKFA